jgi:hypothetical protein
MGVAAVAAVAGVAALSAFVVYRLTRPPTGAERVRRLLPAGLAGLGAWGRPRERSAMRRRRQRTPPVRIYVGDRQVDEESKPYRWEGLVLRAVQTAATAAAGVLASRLIAALASGAADAAARNRGTSE